MGVSQGEDRVMDMHCSLPTVDFTPESFTDDAVGAMSWRNSNEVIVGYTSRKLRGYDKRADVPGRLKFAVIPYERCQPIEGGHANSMTLLPDEHGWT